MEKVVFSTPLGRMGLLHDQGVLKEICLSAKEPETMKLSVDGRKLKRAVNEYLANPSCEIVAPFEMGGTEFEKKVYVELWKTKPGETLSYKELARRVGRPKAFRAVARTMAKNRLPLLVPCHRVINTGGKLGGFSGGLHRKLWLLEHEKRASGLTQRP